MKLFLISAASVIITSLIIASSSPGAEILTREAGRVTMKVTNSKATVTWNRGRATICCAKNAREPSQTIKQVAFVIKYGATAAGACLTPRQGVTLSAKVCRAFDGSHWALQKWERLWPNYGGNSAAQELIISHWSGEQAKFVDVHWESKFNLPVLCGTLTYKGKPVYGFTSTPTGVPTDTYGRLVYLDAYNSDYGSGWRRVNSFLTHTGNGSFCYILANHKAGSGRGASLYRITANGPGVTPVVRMIVQPYA